MTIEVSLEELVRAGAHFGHQSRRWNPKIAPYIYSEKDGVHIFDLTKTKEKLEEALDFLQKAAKEGKSIIFVGTKKQARDKILKTAQATNSFYVIERWLGGTITNFDQIKKSTAKMAEMKAKKEKGEYRNFTKKERLLIDREIERLERFFGGLANITKTPDILVVVDVKQERGAVKEARSAGIEIVGIVDSNSDPTDVDYPIPMNDDATKAVEYVLDLIEAAILNKKVEKRRVEKTGKKTKKVKKGKADKKEKH